MESETLGRNKGLRLRYTLKRVAKAHNMETSIRKSLKVAQRLLDSQFFFKIQTFSVTINEY